MRRTLGINGAFNLNRLFVPLMPRVGLLITMEK
jgi:hypothetical protein